MNFKSFLWIVVFLCLISPSWSQESGETMRGEKLVNEAVRLWESSRIYEAEMAFEAAGEWYETRCDAAPVACGDFHRQYGRFLTEMNNQSDARAQLDQALKIFRQHLGPQHLKVGECLADQGELTMEGLDFNKARDQYHEALQIYQLNLPEHHPKLVGIYAQLSWTHVWMEENEETLKYLTLAKSASKGLPEDSPEMADLYHHLGNLYVNLEDSAQALANYLKAAEIRKKLAPDSRLMKIGLGRTTSNLGILYKDFDNELEARKYWLEAAEIYEKAVGPGHLRRCIVLGWAGQSYLREGNFKESLSTIHRGLQGVFPDFNPKDDYEMPKEMVSAANETAASLLQYKATALEARYNANHANIRDLESALEHYILSIDLLDSLRFDMAGLETRSYLTWRLKPSIEGGMRISTQLFAQSHDAKYEAIVLEMMEKMKAITHLSALAGEKALSNLGAASNPWIISDNALSLEILEYRRQLASFLLPRDSTPKEIQNEIREKFLEASSKRVIVLDSIQEQVPEYFSLKYGLKMTKPDEIRAHLAPKDVFIEYIFTDSSYWGLAISRDTFQFKQLGRMDSIDALSARFLAIFSPGKISDRSLREAWISHSHTLYQTLLGPFEAMIQENGILFISPDGPLARNPFEVFLKTIPGKEDLMTWRSLDYLIRHNPISYANSATILYGFNDLKRPAANGGMLSLAPDFTGYEQPSRMGLNALKFTTEEVDRLSKIYQGKVVKGQEATESYFKQEASNYKILHLATHAIADLNSPHDSKILLSKDPDGKEDGSLYLYELMNMHFAADLVVLSACNTGNGTEFDGEGPVSLARGFQYAGCPSVVMSLWEVDDQATANVMELFYTFLAAGENKPEAMRKAKLAYLENAPPERDHPYFWAGFVHNGAPDPISDYTILWISLILGGLALAGGIVAWERDLL